MRQPRNRERMGRGERRWQRASSASADGGWTVPTLKQREGSIPLSRGHVGNPSGLPHPRLGGAGASAGDPRSHRPPVPCGLAPRRGGLEKHYLCDLKPLLCCKAKNSCSLLRSTSSQSQLGSVIAYFILFYILFNFFDSHLVYFFLFVFFFFSLFSVLFILSV